MLLLTLTIVVSQIKPGHSNLIALSATKIDADPGIRTLAPDRRNCRFDDETENMTIHRSYSLGSCVFECGLRFAQVRLDIYRKLIIPLSMIDH